VSPEISVNPLIFLTLAASFSRDWSETDVYVIVFVG
jgi:hypothetical protein